MSIARLPRCVSLVLWLALWPAVARAADRTTADVAVSVAGPEAAAVRLVPESGATPFWSATVPAGRRHTFHAVPAGRYTLSAAAGSSAFIDIDLIVSPGDVALVVVSANGTAPPRLDVSFQSQPGQGATFGEAELAALPSDRHLWALVDTAAPFVIADQIDNGGLTTGRWARVGSRGSSWLSTRAYVGPQELDGPDDRGRLTFYPDLAAMRAVTLLSGLADPTIDTPGAAIVMVPARPGTTRHLAIGGAFTAPGMVTAVAGEPAPEIGRVDEWQDGYLRWDGPLTAGLGAVITASVTRLTDLRRGAPPAGSSTVSSFTAHLVAAPGDRDEVRLFASAQQVRRPFDLQPHTDGAAAERDRLFGASLTWDRRGAGGSARTLSVGFRRAAYTPDGLGTGAMTIDRATFGPVPAPASADIARTVDARLTLAPEDRRVASLDHSVRFTLDLRRTDRSAAPVAWPAIAELTAGVPARAWEAGSSGTSRRHVTRLVAAVSDDIALARRLTLALGLRADVSSGSAAGASGRVTWRSASPLAVIRWTPRALAMTAGYRRYASGLSTDLLAFGDPGEPAIDVYRWSDENADGLFEDAERGVLVARAGRAPSLASIASDLRPAHTDEFSLRAERALGAGQSLRVTATVRREYDVLRSINVGAPLAAYTAVTVPNRIDDPKRARDGLLTVYDRQPASFGEDQYILQNVSGVGARYRGLEVAWQLRSRRWFSMAGASAYESSGLGGNRGFRVDENDPGVIGEALENPNASSYGDSRGFFDRAYVLKWSTGFRSANGFTAGVTARYQDGQAFARMVLVPDLAQGAEIVASDYAEATRFSFTGTIDLRIGKTFTVGRRRVAATLDVFNLSNLRDEVEEYAVSGPDFRISTAMQPTRTVRAGFRVEF